MNRSVRISFELQITFMKSDCAPHNFLLSENAVMWLLLSQQLTSAVVGEPFKYSTGHELESSYPPHILTPVSLRLLPYFFCSCCSNLEHRASVKRSVSLQFLNHRQSVELLGRGISPSQGRYLLETQNKRKQTSMPWVGFEPTIPVFVRAKIFHALDRPATVIGPPPCTFCYIAQYVQKILCSGRNGRNNSHTSGHQY
jgi:hypothetical protein